MSFAHVLKTGRVPEPLLLAEEQPLYYQLKRFALQGGSPTMVFSPLLTSWQRQRVHVLARSLSLSLLHTECLVWS
jgi:hypothetical protein